MKELVRAELSKMIGNKAVKGAVFLCLVYIVIAIFFSVRGESYTTYNNDTNKLLEYNGLNAIRHKNKDMKDVSCQLTESRIEKLITKVQDLEKEQNVNSVFDLNDNVYFQEIDRYWDIIDLINISYSTEDGFDATVINKVKASEAGAFYQNRVKSIKEKLNVYHSGYGKISGKQKKVILDQANKLKTPLSYKCFDGWSKIIDNFYVLNIVTILMICFAVSILFTLEYQNGMILIVLSTPNGKSKMISAKLRTASIFSTSLIIVANLIFLAVMLLIYGSSAWNSSIQIKASYWLSLYNIQFYQLILYGIIISILAGLLMVMITACISYIVKKTFLTVSLSLLFLFIAKLVPVRGLPKVLDNLIHMVPINSFNIDYEARVESTVSLFGREYIRGYVTPIFLVICIAILIPIVKKLYRTQEA